VRSRYANILTLVCALLAFVPILAVDYLLDGYVRAHEQRALQQSAEAVANSIRQSASDASVAVRRIVENSPSLCAPTFLANARAELGASLSLRQVLVENLDKVQYCDAWGETVRYSPLSETISVPGHTETLTIVALGSLAMPVLKLTHPVNERRTLSMFTPVLNQAPGMMLADRHPATIAKIDLTNGVEVLRAGDVETYDATSETDAYVVARAFAGEYPVSVEIATPFAVVRADYADLDIAITTVAALLSATLLLLMLQYVRRSQVPAFDLERAIARGEIKPFYQPVINLRTGQLMGCEMLCRWEKPGGKVVPPNVFIEYAEVTGLAVPMTLSLMEQVRTDLGALAAAMPDMKISINLFDGHFLNGAIVEDVQAIFGGSTIAYNQLVFEITERRPLANSAQTHAVISGLHALGAKLALDDTGTGHSSLAYLATLGVDIIKIDRIFVDMIKPGVTQVPVLDGLIAMASDLGTEIVAEGVETEEQAIYLRSRGVLQAQGFFFAPALRAPAFRELAAALQATAPRPKKPALVA
jgi:EAL domain-containing protein (putative c-di-GMP-specific phosphodiesterase class I)